jgi:hypothetical protein
VRAKVYVDGVYFEDAKIISQDNLDELRQEYEDLPQRYSQDRKQFDQDPAAYSGLLGSAAEPTRHQWHILRSLNQHARDTVSNYSGSVGFISGYRCPVGNSREQNSVLTSNHQYGRAFDFDQPTSQENYDVFRAARDAGAAADTYLWVNTDYSGCGSLRRFWDVRGACEAITWPLPDGVEYTAGHAAWNN